MGCTARIIRCFEQAVHLIRRLRGVPVSIGEGMGCGLPITVSDVLYLFPHPKHRCDLLTSPSTLYVLY